MPVPSSLASLSTTPGSNSPGGGENPFPELDDHIRQGYAFTAQLRDQKLNSSAVSAYMLTVLDDANAGAARTTLGAVGNTGNETIAGVKTFSSAPVSSAAAVAANELMRKGEVDSAVAARAALAGSASQVFAVGTATDPTHAVRKDQVEGEVKTALNATGSAPVYGIRAWAQFNGTSPLVINAQGNIASIVRLGTGDYEVTFTQAMPTANYAIGGNGGASDRGHTYDIVTRSTTGFRFRTHSDFGGSYPLTDRADISIFVVC